MSGRPSAGIHVEKANHPRSPPVACMSERHKRNFGAGRQVNNWLAAKRLAQINLNFRYRTVDSSQCFFLVHRLASFHLLGPCVKRWQYIRRIANVTRRVIQFSCRRDVRANVLIAPHDVHKGGLAGCTSAKESLRVKLFESINEDLPPL